MSKDKATKKGGTSQRASKDASEASSQKKKRTRIWLNTMVHLTLPDDVDFEIKQYADRKKMSLVEVVGEAVNWFIKTHATKQTLMYMADTKQFKQRQYWVEKIAYSNAEKASKRDGVAIRTVVYTALMMYHDSQITAEKVFQFPK